MTFTNILTLDKNFTLNKKYSRLSGNEYSLQTSKYTPIIIDNGSYRFRSGFADKPDPLLSIPQLVGHYKNTKKNQHFVLIGDELENFTKNRVKLKTPFEKDIICHFDQMEYILDYSFNCLGINSEYVNHPILMTEPFMNPNFCRKEISELLFECYNVPSVYYGIDALFSFYYNTYNQNLITDQLKDALIIRPGYFSTLILPFIDHKIDFSNAFKISVGGHHCANYLFQQLGFKYTQHRDLLTESRIQEMISKLCYTSLNYIDEINKIEQNQDKNLYKVQLPYVKPDKPVMKSKEELQEIREKRRQNGLRLQNLAINRKKNKLEEQKDLLSVYQTLLQQYSEQKISEKKYINQLKENGFSSSSDLENFCSSLEQRIIRLENEIDIDNSSNNNKKESELYPLLSIDDEKLTQSELKEKTLQKIRYKAKIEKQKKNEEKEKQKLLKEQEILLEEQKFNEDPLAFCSELHQRKKALLLTKEAKVKTREHLRRRKSEQARKRMRLLAEMGSGKLEDNFGEEDSHWNQYRELNDINEDNENDDRVSFELEEIEAKLKKYDPKSSVLNWNSVTDKDFQLSLSVDRIRIPEIFFQPSLIGVKQGGITDVIQHIFKNYSKYQREKLSQNIFVCGGSSQYRCFNDRLITEIRSFEPLGSNIQIKSARDPVYDSWKGARLFSQTEDFNKFSITREDYLEKGGDYLKEHNFCNLYYPTISLLHGKNQEHDTDYFSDGNGSN